MKTAERKLLACCLVLILASFAAGLLAAPANLGFQLSHATRPPTAYVNARVLAANVAETITAPTITGATGRKLAIVLSSSCADFYVRTGGTAAVPAADVTDGTGSERNPTSLSVDQGATLSVIAPTTCIVTAAVYYAAGV